MTSSVVFAEEYNSIVCKKGSAADRSISLLREEAYAQYCDKPMNVEQYTIKALSEKEQNELAVVLNQYTEFRSSLPSVIDEDSSLCTGNLDAFLENLSLNINSVAYYNRVDKIYSTTYKYLKTNYIIENIIENKKFAFVDLYENLEFEYSELEEPSFLQTHYNVSLIRYEERWLVISVESDDELFEEYEGKYFDLEREISGVDEAFKLNSYYTEKFEGEDVKDEAEELLPLRYTGNRSYTKTNAVNYALTYSINDYTLTTPSFRNSRFHYGSADCMRFVSQCVWAGFGGSNDQTQINNKYGMDTTGESSWYCTKTSDDLGWRYTSTFKANIEYNLSYSGESGIRGKTNEVGYSSDTLTSATVSQSDLYGAVVLVRGGAGEHHHATILTKVSGTTRSTVYFTAYNHCARNCKLSSKFPSSTTNTLNGAYVIVPQYIKDANFPDGNYFYGTLLPSQSYNATVTVSGHANTSLPTIKLYVYPPSSSSPAYTFTAHTSTTVYGTITLDQSGEWRITVEGVGINNTFTYTVRVKQSS